MPLDLFRTSPVAPAAGPGPSQVPQTTLKTLNTNKRSLSDMEEGDDRDAKKPKQPDEANGVHESKNKKRKKKKRKLPLVEPGNATKHVVPTATASASRVLSAEEMESVSRNASPGPSRTSGSSEPSDASFNAPVQKSVRAPEIPCASAKGKGRAIDEGPLPQTMESPEEQIARLTRQLAEKSEIIEKHENVVSQLQQSMTCQICVDFMYKPYALAPCGHLACYGCLVKWFKAAHSGGHAPPVHLRRKTCPHCRAIVKERPVEVWGVKDMVGTLSKSGLLPNVISPIDEDAQAPEDPWAGIFRKPPPGAAQYPYFYMPFFPNAVDDEEPHPAPPAQGEDMGMLDLEDGGVYRCLDCMHEIWDGVCSSCGRVYHGHLRGPQLNRHPYDLGALDGLAIEEYPDEDEFEGWAANFRGMEPSVDDEGESGGSEPDEEEDELRAHLYRRYGLGAPLRHLDGDEEDEDEEEGEDAYDENDSFIDDEGDEGIPRPVRLSAVSDVMDLVSEPASDGAGPSRPRLPPTLRPIIISSDEDDNSDDEIRILRHRRVPYPVLPRRVTRSGPPVVILSDEEDELDEDGQERDGVSTAATAGSRAAGRRVVDSEEDEESDGGTESHLENHSDFDGENSGSDGEPDPNLADLVAQRELELYGEDDSAPRVSTRGVSPAAAAQPRVENMLEIFADEERAYESDSDDAFEDADDGSRVPWLEGDEEAEEGYESEYEY